MLLSGMKGIHPLKSPRENSVSWHPLKLICRDSRVLPGTKPALSGLVTHESGVCTSVLMDLNTVTLVYVQERNLPNMGLVTHEPGTSDL